MTAVQPRTRRSLRRRDTIPPRKVFLHAALFTGVVVLLVWGALSIYGGAPWNSYKTVYVVVPDTGNLRPHDPVKVGGVNVGQVGAIQITQDGDARLRLQVDASTKLPLGTSFSLRAAGLLGGRYVQLIPGRGKTELASGTTLSGGVDSLTYGVPEALNVFNDSTRGALGALVNGLGEGLLGRGSGLNQSIHLISIWSKPGQRLLQGLLSAGDLHALVPSLDSLTAPLDAARTQIAALLAPASRALQPFVSQRPAVQQTLDDAPGALSTASSGLASGQKLLTAANSLMVAAKAVLPDAPAGLRETTELLSSSHPALAAAHGLLIAAKPAVPAALNITDALRPALTPLNDTLSQATPIVNTVAPYGCNVINTAAVLRSMTGFGGTTGAGPGGPPMAFRLELILAPPTEILGTKDYTGLVQRVGYAMPCTNLASSYPTATNPTAGLLGSGS